MGIEIYTYTNYREYLRAWFEDRDGRPSRRAFASRVDCSPAMLTSLIKGERDLNPSWCASFSKELGHDAEESRYFTDLVELDSPLKARRSAAWHRIRAMRRFRNADKIADSRALLVANWHYVAILELARCGPLGDPTEIAAKLDPPISAAEASEAVTALTELGFFIEDQGVVRLADEVVTSHDIPPGELSKALVIWYAGLFERAARSLTAHPSSERHLGSVTVAIPSSRLPEIRQKLAELERALIDAAAIEETPDRVYQVAIALFPVTNIT